MLQDAAAVAYEGHRLIAESERVRAEAYGILGAESSERAKMLLGLDRAARPPRRMIPTLVSRDVPSRRVETPVASPVAAPTSEPTAVAPETGDVGDAGRSAEARAASPQQGESSSEGDEAPAILDDIALLRQFDPREISVNQLVACYPRVWPPHMAPITIPRTAEHDTLYQCPVLHCKFEPAKRPTTWGHIAADHLGQCMLCAFCDREKPFYSPDGYKVHLRLRCPLTYYKGKAKPAAKGAAEPAAKRRKTNPDA